MLSLRLADGDRKDDRINRTAIESLLYHPQGGFVQGNGRALFIPAVVGDKLFLQRAITNQNLLCESEVG